MGEENVKSIDDIRKDMASIKKHIGGLTVKFNEGREDVMNSLKAGYRSRDSFLDTMNYVRVFDEAEIRPCRDFVDYVNRNAGKEFLFMEYKVSPSEDMVSRECVAGLEPEFTGAQFRPGIEGVVDGFSLKEGFKGPVNFYNKKVVLEYGVISGEVGFEVTENSFCIPTGGAHLKFNIDRPMDYDGVFRFGVIADDFDDRENVYSSKVAHSFRDVSPIFVCPDFNFLRSTEGGFSAFYAGERVGEFFDFESVLGGKKFYEKIRAEVMKD